MLRRISMRDRALAGDHVGIVERVDEAQPCCGGELAAHARMRVVVGDRRAARPRRRARATASTLIDGVVRRHHDRRRACRSSRAASATPCA